MSPLPPSMPPSMPPRCRNLNPDLAAHSPDARALPDKPGLPTTAQATRSSPRAAQMAGYADFTVVVVVIAVTLLALLMTF